jgi:hypothetical protein
MYGVRGGCPIQASAPEIVSPVNKVADAPARIMESVHAIEVLAHNPLIGRPVDIASGPAAK